MIITGRVKYEIMNEWTKEQTIKKKLIDTFIYLLILFTDLQAKPN